MENTKLNHYRNMHKHLPEANIRDFFAQSIGEAHQISIPMHVREKKWAECAHLKGLEWQIARKKAEITFLESDLKEAERLSAIVTLIESKGWEEHDISDYIVWKDKDATCYSFIGTEKEKDDYLKMIEGLE